MKYTQTVEIQAMTQMKGREARVLARVLKDAKEADEMVEAVMAAAEMEVAVMVAKKVAMTVVDKAMTEAKGEEAARGGDKSNI